MTERVFIASTGMFAGMALGVSISGVPAIYISQKPKDTWKTVYDTGKTLAIPLVLATAISGGMLYQRTSNPKILAATIIGAFPMPFTILAMRSNIKALESASNVDPNVKDLTRTWAKLHAVRTVAGIASFGIAIYSLL